MNKIYPYKSITKPVSEKINNQEGLYLDVCLEWINVLLRLALKQYWGKTLVVVGNSRKVFLD